MIYHWCRAADWEAAGDRYAPAGLAEEGFIHCSFAHQVATVATALYRGQTDLVILTIDERGLPVVVEDCYESGEEFPHVYGPIPRAAVVEVRPFPPNPDGTFSIPARE